MSHVKRLRIDAKDGEVLKLQALNTSALVIIISAPSERTSIPQSSMSLQHHNSISTLVLHQATSHLQRIDINEGAMPNLEGLHIANCPGLKELAQGMEYLTKLEIFGWINPDRTLIERVQREETEKKLSAERERISQCCLFLFFSDRTLNDSFKYIE